MKIKVSSSVLLKALSSINGVIVNNPVLPILENFLFEVDNGILSATASDLQTTVMVSVSVDSDTNGSIAVPAKILMETLRNLPEQAITVQVDDETYSIEIVSDNGRYKLSGENAVDFPVIPPVNNAFSISAPAETLLRAINYTLFATGNDDLRPAMSGVHVKLLPTGAVFASTDGHRLVKYTREDIVSTNETKLLLPRKALSLLKTMLPDDGSATLINFNNTNAFFEFNQTRMICRLIDERFPEYENAIPLNNSNVLTINRLELLNSLKRIAIYANKSSQQIRMKLSATELVTSAEDLDYSNEAKETLPCEYEGEPMEIGFSAKILIETLANLHSNMIDMTFSIPSKAALIYPKTKDDEEDLLMLVMPTMLSQ
jgi:DNA polymerase-3 subunit beta